LTDSKGRTVDFKNTVLIMTSNLGSTGAIPPNSLVDTTEKERVLEALKNHFRPEFLNRIDDIVVFTKLSKEALAGIIDVQLRRLHKLLAEKNLTIELDESAKHLLLEEGYDPAFGARPLKRAIQTMIQNPLAVKLLNGEVSSGQNVKVSAKDGKLVFTPETAKAAA
jgi:ATP-dependent Clp protease ATP-binding subunit ClpB